MLINTTEIQIAALEKRSNCSTQRKIQIQNALLANSLAYQDYMQNPNQIASIVKRSSLSKTTQIQIQIQITSFQYGLAYQNYLESKSKLRH